MLSTLRPHPSRSDTWPKFRSTVPLAHCSFAGAELVAGHAWRLRGGAAGTWLPSSHSAVGGAAARAASIPRRVCMRVRKVTPASVAGQHARTDRLVPDNLRALVSGIGPFS